MSRRFSIISWSLFLTAIAVYVITAIYPLWSERTDNDFKHIYLGMKALLDGNSPYPIRSLHHQAALQGFTQIALNPYVYLPFTGYTMSFLAPFSLSQASQVWFLINHLLVGGCIYYLSTFFPGRRVLAAAIQTLLFALSIPFLRTLSAGQLNLPQLFFIILAFSLLSNNKQRWAGVCLAIITLYKLMPGIYLFYFLLRKKYEALLSMAITGLVLLVASTAMAGFKITAEFFPVLQQMGYGKSTWAWANSFWDDPPNQSLNSLYSHLFTISNHTIPWVDLGQPAANALTLASVLILVALWIIAPYKKKQAEPPSGNEFTPTDQAIYCSTLVLGLLTPSLMWDHYLVMLIFPAAWIFAYGIPRKLWGAICTTLVCIILVNIPWNFEDESWRKGPGILLMSMKLWPTLALFGVTLHLAITAKPRDNQSSVLSG